MEKLQYIFLSIIGISVLLMLIFALLSRRFFKTLILNAFLGVAAIAVIDITSRLTGVYIPLNFWTVGTGGIMGLPGVFGILILNFLSL